MKPLSIGEQILTGLIKPTPEQSERIIRLFEADEPDGIEPLSERQEAQYRAVEISHMYATDAVSVTALFERMERDDDAYGLELSADGTVGAWTCHGLLSSGKDAHVVARLENGVVYWKTV